MSEVIKFNTEELAKVNPVPQTQVPIFDLVAEDHPILKEDLPLFDFSNPPVNPNAFASTLVETCKALKGIGLSANQCGFAHRVFVMGAEDKYVAFFNPSIVQSSEEEVHMLEGCLSFPLLGLRITRPKEIVVEYQDFNGVVRQATYQGLTARCFQHELDHMNGVVYTQRAKPMALKSGEIKRKKLTKKIKL